MEASENLDRNVISYESYRLSWLAYIGVMLTFLIQLAVSAGIGWWAMNKAPNQQWHQIGIAAGVLVVMIAIAIFIYKILFLRSVRLYTDEIGVWLYRGILPWSRGHLGVKWRDIEDAVHFMGFFSWIFRSYSVRIGHRFTKTSEITVTHLARGNKATEHINQRHQHMLRNEQTIERSLEV